MTVLIVDDHPSFRASARTLLEAEGYVIVGMEYINREGTNDAKEDIENLNRIRAFVSSKYAPAMPRSKPRAASSRARLPAAAA